MQAILTTYYGPTNHNAARIKASCDRGSMFVSYPYKLSGQDCHVYAADALCLKFAIEDQKRTGESIEGNTWQRRRIAGQLSSGSWAHVFVD